MTAYHGGKHRTGKRIAECIVEYVDKVQKQTGIKIKGYCEPFCGMLGVYRHIPSLFEEKGYNDLKYLGGDTNESVVMMWKAAQKGWKPPNTCSERIYDKLRYDPKPSAEKGFCCHQFSFGGIYCGGYACKYGKAKDASSTVNRIVDISQELYDIKLYVGEYDIFTGLKGYVIYCDPPYEGTTCQYKSEERSVKTFNSNRFWIWAEYMSKNNLVIVSEYKAPNSFKCILNQKHYGQHNRSGDKYKFTGNEKLFVNVNKLI